MSVTKSTRVATSIEEGARATIVGILADRAIRTGETISVDPDLLGGS